MKQINEKTFKIESRNDLEFRATDDLSIIDLLSLKTALNMSSFMQNRLMYTFILEHTEVKINNSWVRVKTPNQAVYIPVDLEENLSCLEEITFKFIDEILLPFFKKSNE